MGRVGPMNRFDRVYPSNPTFPKTPSPTPQNRLPTGMRNPTPYDSHSKLITSTLECCQKTTRTLGFVREVYRPCRLGNSTFGVANEFHETRSAREIGLKSFAGGSRPSR